MKKISILLLIPLLAACSGNKKASTDTDTDSAFIQQAEEAVDSIQIPSLTAQGLGDIRVGMSVDSIPQGIVNLYDNVSTEETPDATALVFSMGDEQMFTVFDMGGGKVDVIQLISPKIGVKTPDGALHIGDPMTDLIKLSGVTTEFQSMDDTGMWYWRYQGLFFTPTLSNQDQSLVDALSNRRTPPSASLITPSVTIESIATGLPF